MVATLAILFDSNLSNWNYLNILHTRPSKATVQETFLTYSQEWKTKYSVWKVSYMLIKFQNIYMKQMLNCVSFLLYFSIVAKWTKHVMSWKHILQKTERLYTCPYYGDWTTVGGTTPSLRQSSLFALLVQFHRIISSILSMHFIIMHISYTSIKFMMLFNLKSRPTPIGFGYRDSSSWHPTDLAHERSLRITFQPIPFQTLTMGLIHPRKMNN